MRNCPPGTNTIPFVAVFTTYGPLATTSPKDPFCPRLLHSAGPGTQRRRDGSSADETLSTRSYRRGRANPRNVTAAVTATQYHPQASTEHRLRLREPTNASHDVLAGFS